jgi:hypothetical protein
MIRKRTKDWKATGPARSVSIRNNVYPTLMINSEYTHRAGTGQFGKSPEGIDHV